MMQSAWEYYNNLCSTLNLTSGIRFQPTDRELIAHFLIPKISNKKQKVQGAGEALESGVREGVDLYAEEPWVIWDRFCNNTTSDDDDDAGLYFYTRLKHKEKASGVGLGRKRKPRIDRRVAQGKGSWHMEYCGTPWDVMQGNSQSQSLIAVMKKRFSYRNPNNSEQDRRWLMHEYSSIEHSDWVVCRLRKNPDRGLHPTFPCSLPSTSTTTTITTCDETNPPSKRPKLMAAPENSLITNHQQQRILTNNAGSAEVDHRLDHVNNYGLSGKESNTFCASSSNCGQQLHMVPWTETQSSTSSQWDQYSSRSDTSCAFNEASSSSAAGEQYGGVNQCGNGSNTYCASSDASCSEQTSPWTMAFSSSDHAELDDLLAGLGCESAEFGGGNVWDHSQSPSTSTSLSVIDFDYEEALLSLPPITNMPQVAAF